MPRLILGTAIVLASLQAGAATASGIRSVARIIAGPSPADTFRYPMGLAVDGPRGILAIGDTGNHRVVLFDAMGRYRGALSWSGAPGNAQGEPKCVALDGRGRLFVLDAIAARIDVSSPAGSRLGSLAPDLPAAIAGEVRPQFVAIGPSGTLYVLYAGERAGIAILERNGSTRRLLGFETRGLFEAPVALAVDAGETRIAVADPMARHQVKIVGADGALLTSFGPHGEGDGTFSLASFVAWGPDDTLWIVDTMRHSVGIHAADGTYVGRIGGFGSGPGQFDYPSACAFLDANRLVVLERAGARLQIFELEPLRTEVPGGELGRSASGAPGAGDSNTGRR